MQAVGGFQISESHLPILYYQAPREEWETNHSGSLLFAVAALVNLIGAFHDRDSGPVDSRPVCTWVQAQFSVLGTGHARCHGHG